MGRRFDRNTRELFGEIQAQIATINGRLLNPKGADIPALQAAKAKLQAKGKELRQKYSAEVSKRVLADADNLIARLNSIDISSMRKE